MTFAEAFIGNMLSLFKSKKINVENLSKSVFKIKKVDEQIQLFEMKQQELKDGKTLFFLDLIQVVEQLLSIPEILIGLFPF